MDAYNSAAWSLRAIVTWRDCLPNVSWQDNSPDPGCLLDLAPREGSKCVSLRRAKEDAERKERQERQLKAEASRAKKKADELKKKVSTLPCAVVADDHA